MEVCFGTVKTRISIVWRSFKIQRWVKRHGQGSDGWWYGRGQANADKGSVEVHTNRWWWYQKPQKEARNASMGPAYKKAGPPFTAPLIYHTQHSDTSSSCLFDLTPPFSLFPTPSLPIFTLLPLSPKVPRHCKLLLIRGWLLIIKRVKLYSVYI